jgi:hypothetical protein
LYTDNQIQKGTAVSSLASLPPDVLSLMVALIASAAGKVLPSDELNVLGNLVAAIGTTMSTIAAQEAYLQIVREQKAAEESPDEQTEDTQKQVEDLKKRIELLESRLR